MLYLYIGLLQTTSMNMAQVEGKFLAVSLGLTFLTGVFVGWKLKAWHIKYLQAKRDYMKNRFIAAQEKLNAASS